MDSVFSMKLSKKKQDESNKLKEIWEKAVNVEKMHEIEIKSMIGFEEMLACSIKCLYVKKIIK